MLFVLVVTTTLVTFLIAGEASYLLPIFITDLLLIVLIVFHVKTCFHFKLMCNYQKVYIVNWSD